MNALEKRAGVPWFNQDSIWNELNRLFDNDDLRWSKGTSFPKINVYKDGEGVIVSAEVPGVNPNKLEITVKDSLVSISGEVPGRARSEHDSYHRCERSTGKFHRELKLPYHADPNQVSAQCTNGVLKISLPRLAEDKPRKITINAS